MNKQSKIINKRALIALLISIPASSFGMQYFSESFRAPANNEARNIAIRSSFNWTPLHDAVFNGRKEDAEQLLQGGACIDAVDQAGHTPLHVATRHTEMVDLLIRAGANVHVEDWDGETPLHTAVIYGQTEVVTLLLRAGAYRDAVNRLGWTPLHMAIAQGQTEVIALLLQASTNTEPQNSE
jgi:ankyrin repeat protein